MKNEKKSKSKAKKMMYGGGLKKMKDGGGVCAGASNYRRSRQGAEIAR